MIKEEVSPEWGPSLYMELPEHFRRKEEQREISTSQKGEQPHVLEEADICRFSFTAVKSKGDEEKPQSSYLCQGQTKEKKEAGHSGSSSATQMKAETTSKDCRGSEPTRKQDADGHLQPETDEKVSDSETDDSDDWQESLSESGPYIDNSNSDWTESRETKSSVNTQKCKGTPVSSVGCNIGQKSVNCFEFLKVFHFMGSIDSQVRDIRGEKEKKFACDICGKRFIRKHNMKSHMMVHTEPKTYSCEVCGKTFTEKVKLKNHKTNHTERKFACSVCDKSFMHRGHIDRHMKSHTGEKPFNCDVCGKRFSLRGNLKQHTRLHTGEKPHGCDVCGKKYSESAKLRKHMVVHTGEKPYGCDICGKRFTKSGSLKIHVRIHTGERPFGCDVCGKRFRQQGDVKKHMNIHTREKPLDCNYCGKGFTQQGKLTAHMSVHKAEEPLS